MPDAPQPHDDQLWPAIDENAARIRDLVAELDQAYGTVEALSSLLRLLLDRVRLNPGGREMMKLADHVEVELLAALRHRTH